MGFSKQTTLTGLAHLVVLQVMALSEVLKPRQRTARLPKLGWENLTIAAVAWFILGIFSGIFGKHIWIEYKHIQTKAFKSKVGARENMWHLGCELVFSSRSGEIFHPEDVPQAVANVPQRGDLFSDVCRIIVIIPFFAKHSSRKNSIILAFQTHETLWFSAYYSIAIQWWKAMNPPRPRPSADGCPFSTWRFFARHSWICHVHPICYCNFSTTWGIKYGTFCMKLIVLIFFKTNISWRCQFIHTGAQQQGRSRLCWTLLIAIAL